jgi:hypothetical protein
MAAPATAVLAVAALLGALGAGSVPGASSAAPTEQLRSESANAMPVPFRVGERLTYAVNFGGLQIGTAQMSVLGVEDVRGRPSYHVLFTIEGGMPLLRVQDRYESWIDTATLASRRHVQEIREGGYRRNTRYEIYPEQRRYRENDEDSLRASVAHPLDEGSFVYFIRAVHVPVGQTREFHQYFKPDRNPVIIRALRRDTVEVPSGRYPTVVVRPSIRARGIFAEDGDAQLWFSDDPRRILVRMNAKFAGIALSLVLTDYQAGES